MKYYSQNILHTKLLHKTLPILKLDISTWRAYISLLLHGDIVKHIWYMIPHRHADVIYIQPLCDASLGIHSYMYIFDIYYHFICRCSGPSHCQDSKPSQMIIFDMCSLQTMTFHFQCIDLFLGGCWDFTGLYYTLGVTNYLDVSNMIPQWKTSHISEYNEAETTWPPFPNEFF